MRNREQNTKEKPYPADEKIILGAEALIGLTFPSELRAFYENDGYLSIQKSGENEIKVLDPLSVAALRLRIDVYENHKSLNDYKQYEDKTLLFFKKDEDHFFGIELADTPKQKIYDHGQVIADSLEEFLRMFYKQK